MGNCFGFPGVETLNSVFTWLWCEGSFIRNLEENLADLRRQMDDLKATENEVKNKVEMEKRPHQQMRPTVRKWLTRVEEIHKRFDDLVSDSTAQLEYLCLCSLCSQNVYSSYKYGKSVLLLSEDVKRLKSEGTFEEVTELTSRSEVVERPTRVTVGQEEMLEKAWNRVMKDGVGILGLHGMGGVGKTTVFKKIHNKFAEIDDKFDVVIWIVVSRGANICKLQEDIAQKLKLCGLDWKNKSESDKAVEMHRVLKEKRFVLMLDDVWEKIDLEAIGVPFPTRENGCKVTFTTRSKEVCSRMGDHEPMQVKCLERDQAWELFKSKVGDNTLKDPLVLELARKVAEKCHGLPLALSVIGETMSFKTAVQEWEDTIDELTRSAAKFSDMENKILPVLKFSYDSLVDEHIRSCFLYCALFPEDYEIVKERLIEYWRCEGFIGEHQVSRRAVNKGYGVLGTLIRANLLTEIDTERVVMHDVIREMALWIASDFGKQNENYVVQAKVGLGKIPEVKDWGAVRRMSLIENQIEEISCGPKCSELTTLFLQNNHMKNLSGEFIRSMQKLVVLDLSDNYDINELPEQISELTSLQYLDLSFTDIKHLPVGFQELKKLTHLNLSFTVKLCGLSGISKLSSLRILKLHGSKVHADVSLVKELQLLEHLQVLTIHVSTELCLNQILGDKRLANCIDDMYVTFDAQLKPMDLSLLLSMANLRRLFLRNIHLLEIDTKKKRRDSSDLHNPIISCFTNLSTVVIRQCNSIKDLTWLLFAPNLVKLIVTHAEEMQEIINEEKAATKLKGYSPFRKLESLTLQDLPKLESIYWSPLPFPFLVYVEITSCPNLRKLPLNSTSVSRVEELKIKMDHSQETELEWEDEDTKNRFLPLINEW